MTYAELTQLVQDYLENDDPELIAHIPTFIRNAERRIYREAQLDMERKFSRALSTQGSRLIAKPADMVYDTGLFIRQGTNNQYILRKDTSFIEVFSPDPTAQAFPRYYSDWDESTFVLAPTPNGAYQMTLHYVAFPDGLSPTVTSTVLSTRYPEILQYATLIEAYAFEKTADTNAELQLWTSLYEEAMQTLRFNEQTKQHTPDSQFGEPT